MKESTFYQAIAEEGRQKEALKILLGLGARQFKAEPLAEQRAGLEAITDTTRLEDFIDRVDEVETWTELLASQDAPSLPVEKDPKMRP
jgi:hypothetical protein